MSKNKFDFESGGLTSEQTAKLQELMAVLEKANNDLKALVSGADTSPKVDTRELTPMGRVFKSFKNIPLQLFIRWLQGNEQTLLEQERELIEDTFDAGSDILETGSHYFDLQFKQTL